MLLFECLVLPLFFFTSLWLILPSVSGMIWTWLLGSVLLVATLALLHRSKEYWLSISNRYYFSTRDAPFDALILLSPLAVGFALAGGSPVFLAVDRVVSSLLIYPIYALLQLSIFLAIPATRMIRLGYSSRTTCIGCAVVFSLAHLPNPLLMAFTGLAMLALCKQFLKGRSILVLALVMGIAATGFKFMVPYDMELGHADRAGLRGETGGI